MEGNISFAVSRSCSFFVRAVSVNKIPSCGIACDNLNPYFLRCSCFKTIVFGETKFFAKLWFRV